MRAPSDNHREEGQAAISAGDEASSPELRVAIVGAGPAGFYCALELLAQPGGRTRVDMFDRLPAPYGLVRYGVAPDHQKIKSVIKVYERAVEAAGERFRFFGGVELGADVTLDELRERYHAVILTYGAQSDRHLEISGEDLPQVYAAREFVAWYNSHPDFLEHKFDLTAATAVVVGIGNVAIDVARILCRTPAELAATDISHAAEQAIDTSGIRKVVILARRGPLQAACTPVELKELTQMEGASLVVDPRDVEIDPISQASLDSGEVSTQSLKVFQILQAQAGVAPRPDAKIIHMRFYVSPTDILGSDKVEGVRIRRNALRERPDGRIVIEPTDEEEELACGVVFRSIGYKVAAVPGVPFNEARGEIPHQGGQVLASQGGELVPGLFAAGWAKRGPSGVIGTNKPDAAETVATLLASLAQGNLPTPTAGDVTALLAGRGAHFLTYQEWKALDAREIEAGAEAGRPRVKYTDVPGMLEVGPEA